MSNFPTALDTLSTTHFAGEVIASATENAEADAINKIERAARMYASRVVAASNAEPAWQTMASYTCDGTADDVQLNQALVDVSSLPYGTVVLSPGTFTIAATVELPSAPVSLIGQGGKASIIKAVSVLAVPLVRVLGPTGPGVYGVNMQRIAYLGIDGSAATGSAAYNLEIAGAVYQGLFEHLNITGSRGHSVYLHSRNQTQTVNTFGTPTSGTFALRYAGGSPTGAIAYNASAATIQTAIRALAGIGTNVTCTGGPLPAVVTCTFTGALAAYNTAQLIVDSSSVSPGGVFMGVGERPAYNRIAWCNIENGQADGIRSGDTYPSGLYAEHNEFLHNSITFMAGNGIFSTGNNNRIHSNQLDFLDMGVQLVGAENNAVWGNTFDRCATHWAKIDQGGQHTFGFNLLGDRQAGFSAGSRGFYVTGSTSGDKFIGNSVLNQFSAGANGWDYGWDEDSGVGQSGSGFWGQNVYVGNSFSWTRNRFNGARPQMWGNTTSDFTLAGVTGGVHYGSGAPSNTMGINGDTYHRTDTPGTANQRMYVKNAGAWAGVV